MRRIIASAIVLATAPLSKWGGVAGTLPEGWSTAGPLTSRDGPLASGMNLQAARGEPEDAFPSEEKANTSSSPDPPNNLHSVDPENSIVLQARLPSVSSTGEAQREGGQGKDGELEEATSVVEKEEKVWRYGPKVLSVALLVVVLASFVRLLSSSLLWEEGMGESAAVPPQADESTAAPGESNVLPTDKRGPLESGAQHNVEMPKSGDGQSEEIGEVSELRRSIENLTDQFRRASLRTEAWGNRSESVLLSSRAEGGDDSTAQLAVQALVDKVSSISSALAQNVGALCTGLESLAENVRNAKTQEQAEEVASNLRKLLRALENVGNSAASEFFVVTQLTTNMTSQSKKLLELYPDILVLANNLAESLPTPYEKKHASPTPAPEPAEADPLDSLRTLLDSVSVAEALQQAKFQKVLQHPLEGPQFAYLMQLLLKSQEQEDSMHAAVKSLVHAQHSVEEGKLPVDRLNVSAATEMLMAIKEKQITLGEALKLELDLCVERALEHLEAGRVLIGRGEDGRWNRNAHPLLSLARTIRKNTAVVETKLTSWEKHVRSKYP